MVEFLKKPYSVLNYRAMKIGWFYKRFYKRHNTFVKAVFSQESLIFKWVRLFLYCYNIVIVTRSTIIIFVNNGLHIEIIVFDDSIEEYEYEYLSVNNRQNNSGRISSYLRRYLYAHRSKSLRVWWYILCIT